MSTSNLQGVVGLSGLGKSGGGVTRLVDHLHRIQMPNQLTPSDIQRIQRDCEILAEKLRKYPKEMINLSEAIFQNRMDEARQMIASLGLSENNFVEQGGGLLWLVVIAILLYATDAY